MVTRRALMTGMLAGAGGLTASGVGALTDATPPPVADVERIEHAIWRTYYETTRIWGYVDRHSVDPGQTFNLMLSTGPNLKGAKGKIEIYRIGYYGADDRALVWRSPTIEVFHQPVQITAASVGAAWTASIEQIGTGDWRSGYYAIDFVDDLDGLRSINVAFIVVTDGARSGDVLLELSTNTWQAYNEWGGCSFYISDFIGTNAQALSFDRPTAPDFFDYEYYLVLWLEQMAVERNFKVSYATNFDIHRDIAFTEKYKLFISGSHNEYWSLDEFKALHRRIFQLGRNTMFMGANNAYWQIRYSDVNGGAAGDGFQGRQLICFKSLDDPIRYRGEKKKSFDLITMRFRDEARWPETMLTGVGYESWFGSAAMPQITYPYVVARTDLPFFAGTGYKVGESTGNVVGYEWDNTDPMGDGRRLWDKEKSRIPMIDAESIKVLFTGSPVDVDGRPGKAECVYFVSPAGAKVFSSGTIRWALGLGAPGYVQDQFKIFNQNLLEHFLKDA